MATINQCPEWLRNELQRLHFEMEVLEQEDGCYIVTPFLDASGDNIIIRVRQNGNEFLVDDAGFISRLTAYIQPSSAFVRRMNEALRGISDLYGATLDLNEGNVLFSCEESQLSNTVMRAMQAIIALDGNLGFLSVQSTKRPPHTRTSLGPRVATKIAKSIRPILRQQLAHKGAIVSGQAVEDWRVDLLYEPRTFATRSHSRSALISSVVIIALDIAVKEPISKAGDALVRAWDIKGAHQDYEVRVAIDSHGQNGLVAAAKNLLEKHHDNKFLVYDLATTDKLIEFTNQIHADLGAMV